MANPRDTGDNVKVDFVWGNFPMQPNDDREANGGEELDYSLDNHVIVEEGRYGFPGYTPGNVGDGDDIANTTVPAITGVLEATALTRLTNAGLEGVAVATTTEGATEANEGKVASQDPAAGTAANEGDEVEYSLFELVPEVLFGPTTAWFANMGALNLADMTEVAPELTNGGYVNYRVVIVGGVLDGTHVITNVIAPDPGLMMYGTTLNADTFNSAMDVSGSDVQGGSLTIVAA